METQNKKRTRADEKREPDDHNKRKRSSSESVLDFHENYDHPAQYEFGVFDFPWLKEGVIFIADESLGHDEKFVPYDDDDEAFAANFDQSCVQNLFAFSPAAMSEYNIHDKKLDEDGFWSLGIDDFERLDCIWSCPCDQPLDIGLNKGVDCNL